MSYQQSYINSKPSPLRLYLIDGELDKPGAFAETHEMGHSRELHCEKYAKWVMGDIRCSICHKGFVDDELIWHEFMYLTPGGSERNSLFPAMYHYRCVNIEGR